MRLPLLAVAFGAALLGGCATEGYYTGPYYGSGYGYDYYAPDYYYYDYGPAYYTPGLSFYYRDGGSHEHHFSGSNRSFHGSVHAQPRTSTGVARTPSRTHVARGSRQPSRLASRSRTNPEREHGG